MAELTFTYGTMAAGKSTLALQLCWQLREGRHDVALWTFGDRSDDGTVTSRIGIEAAAEAVEPGSDLAERVERLVASGAGILVIDEAQFASRSTRSTRWRAWSTTTASTSTPSACRPTSARTSSRGRRGSSRSPTGPTSSR